MSLVPPQNNEQDILPLDDPEWDWKSFERFCLGFVRAQPEVASANLYGTRGQAQGGIDIVARLNDGRKRTYQCRKRKSFGEADLDNTVEETTYKAEEHSILVTCEVGTNVRDKIDTLKGWSLSDKEDISREVREIEPRERVRRLVEDTFSSAWRRAFLGPSGPLGFWEPEEYFRSFMAEDQLFRHTWELVGRDELLTELVTHADPASPTRVIVLVGRGGVGKTRVLRAVAEADPDRTVLFAEDQVPVSAESVAELPWDGPLVIVDDAHRRDDLDALVGSLRHRDDGATVILATRPQRLEELRAQLSLAGLGPESVWFSDPIEALSTEDVEDLARQALGPVFEHLAGHLAEATADCPLVTVIGGQLLARKAIAPALLEREDDFRQVVLDRFRDEMLGRLGEQVDADIARELLVLLSALAPVSVADQALIGRIAEDLEVDPPAVRLLLGTMQDAGVVLGRGRLRRIVPDVLADHILHRACVTSDGEATGRAEQLLSRYSDLALPALLKNLAELDWRIGQGETELRLLEGFWADIATSLAAGDAEVRLRIIKLISSVAALAPAPVFELVRHALASPAKETEIEALAYRVDDGDVRLALPQLLGSVALSPAYLAGALPLLWELARDDERAPHSHPDHGLRVFEELSSYRLPLLYPEAVLEFTVGILDTPEYSDPHPRSPLELLGPILEREGTTLDMAPLGFQPRAYTVSAEATAQIRGSIRELLLRIAVEGGQRDRVLAAKLLGDALTQPHGYFGNPLPEERIEQWHEDQVAIIGAIEELMERATDPLVRLTIREGIEWHAEHGRWENVRERAGVLLDISLSEEEDLIEAIRRPFDFRDPDASEKRISELADSLLGERDDGEALALRLDQVVALLDQIPPHTPNPSPLLAAIAIADPGAGAGMAEWCAAHEERPLARFADTLLAAVSRADPDGAAAIGERLRGGDTTARRQLASFLAAGTWFDGPAERELGMLRGLLGDEDAYVLRNALLTIHRLGETHPDLAVDLALEVDPGIDPHLADELCMSINDRLESFSDEQIEALLAKLGSVRRLEYWVVKVLANLSGTHPGEVVDFLIARAKAGGEIDAVPYHDFDTILLEDLDSELLAGHLRTVRDAAAGAGSRAQLELSSVYWRLGGKPDLALEVLLEWLGGEDSKHVAAAIALLREVSWQVVLEDPDFVERALLGAVQRGPESLGEMEDPLLSLLAISGDHSRTMGEPSPRNVRLRDEGTELMNGFDLGSPARGFFKKVVGIAERQIAEDELEDEEFEDGR